MYYQAYHFRIYPSENQKILIHKSIGCSRFIYNYFLDECKKNGFSSAFDMIKKLPALESSYPWLKEVDSCSLRNSILYLERAYQNFFAKRSGYPTFKSKNGKESYHTNCIRSTYKGISYSNIQVDLKSKMIKLPKIGKVKIRGYRNLDTLDGRIMNATITKEKTGKYYVSVVVEKKELIPEKVIPSKIVGIDLGVKDLVITSNGEKYKNPKVLTKYEKRIKYLQRKLARQEKRSNNYNKTKRKIAVLYRKIKNTRKHNMIEIVNKITNENDIIVTEKLDVVHMVKNHSLAKNILDATFSKIILLLEWQVKQKGKYFYQVDTYFPSSQLCSRCGSRETKVKDLSVREWECKECGNRNNRDLNASINIMFEGLKQHYKVLSN